MRILVGMPEQGSQGGPAACEPPFISQLRRLGHHVEEEVYAYAQTRSSPLRRISRVRKTARRLSKLLRSNIFDIVHINTSFDTRALMRDAVVVSCLPANGAKIFLKFHGSDARLLKTSNPLLRSLGGYLLARADGIGVLSSEERDNFLEAGVPGSKVFVVKNVVENRTATPDSHFRAKLKLAKQAPLLLFIGRFIEAKGLADVIHACKLLKGRDQDFVLLCVGDGPARESVETEVKRLGLESQVRFFGYVTEEEAAEFYANSTMLVFPTYHYEGFPMVIFNAAAAGLPIITTRIRAAADYLAEPENCLWVKPRSPDELTEAMLALINKQDERNAMRANNRRLVERFSAEIVTREFVESYSRVLTRQGAGKRAPIPGEQDDPRKDTK
jgi:glycosyltransferase involved in cell wall biosynthesis